MKNSFLMFIWLLAISIACTTTEVDDIEVISQESKIQAVQTLCDINGDSCAYPYSSETYTYTSSFTPNDVHWTIQSGNMSVASGQGTSNVTLSFNSNFNGGTLYALGSGSGGIVCSETYSISKCGGINPNCVDCTNPNLFYSSQIKPCYPSVHPHGRFLLSGYPTGASITWSVLNAVIISTSHDYIVFKPTSAGYYTVTATVTWDKNDPCNPGATCTKVFSNSYSTSEGDNCF